LQELVGGLAPGSEAITRGAGRICRSGERLKQMRAPELQLRCARQDGSEPIMSPDEGRHDYQPSKKE